MRYLLLRCLAVLACLGVFSLPQTSAAPKPDQPDKPDFNGTWALDLKASASLEPIMKKVGARLLEQKFASLTTLKPPSDKPNRLSRSLPAAAASP
jgi:hypothetical protein